MHEVVHGGAAGVHADLVVMQRSKGLHLLRKGVVETKGHSGLNFYRNNAFWAVAREPRELLALVLTDDNQPRDIALVRGDKAHGDLYLNVKLAFYAGIRLDPKRLFLGRLAQHAAGNRDPFGGNLYDGPRKGVVVVRLGIRRSGVLVHWRLLRPAMRRHGDRQADEPRFGKVTPHT